MHFVYVILQTKCVIFEVTPQEITLRFVKDGQNTPSQIGCIWRDCALINERSLQVAVHYNFGGLFPIALTDVCCRKERGHKNVYC